MFDSTNMRHANINCKMTTPNDDTSKKPPPPPAVTPSVQPDTIERNPTLSPWNQLDPLASFLAAQSEASQFSYPLAAYTHPQRAGVAFPGGFNPFHYGTAADPIHALIEENETRANKKPSSVATAKKSHSIYTDSDMQALMDAVFEVNPSETRNGWEKVKKKYDQATKTFNRSPNALKSKYESIEKAWETDPKCGRFKTQVLANQKREVLDNSVATSVPNYAGYLHLSSDSTDDDDDEDNQSGTENKAKKARVTKVAPKGNSVNLKRKKYSNQLKTLKEKKRKQELKDEEERKLNQSVVAMLGNMQGGQGVNEMIVKLRFDTDKKFTALDEKMDMVLKKLE